MTLFEFINLDLDDKYEFVWHNTEQVQFNCIREEDDYKFVLFDCGSFFAESCVLKGRTLKIEGFDLTDDRLNLYFDWVNKNKDDPRYQLLD